jgi:tRNA pseudouridine55 synthase
MVTNKTNDFSQLDFIAGENILIDKPPQFTSFKVVRTIKKAISIGRVGHTGTLDPLATGLLIIMTGKNTKQMMNFENLGKCYSGIILLGKSSPSMDTETEMKTLEVPENLNEDLIYRTRDEFLGDIQQVPPMYSALKVKGQKLYNLARQGKIIKREPRNINISKFEITDIRLPEIHFEIRCSKGTYIRVIANDFGNKIGCGAVLKSLRRTEIGPYKIVDALKLDEFVEKVSHQPIIEHSG